MLEGFVEVLHRPANTIGGRAEQPSPLRWRAHSMGATSDSLARVLRWGPRPEQVGIPALGLEASLLA